MFGDEAGAIVVDWGAVLAAVVLNGIMAVYAIFSGDLSPLEQKVSAAIQVAATAEEIGEAQAGAAATPEEITLAVRGGQSISPNP